MDSRLYLYLPIFVAVFSIVIQDGPMDLFLRRFNLLKNRPRSRTDFAPQQSNPARPS
jgi:hypothetical protein